MKIPPQTVMQIWKKPFRFSNHQSSDNIDLRARASSCLKTDRKSSPRNKRESSLQLHDYSYAFKTDLKRKSTGELSEEEIPKHRRTLEPYLASVSNGPILLTAPHGVMVKRGGQIVKQKERTHLREHWVNTITLMLIQAIEEIETKRFAKHHANSTKEMAKLA
jgi:hypothetical protein